MTKASKLLRIVGLITILSLMVVIIPASPVMAVEPITLGPEEGEIGDRIDIEGVGFDAGVICRIYFSSDEADEGDYIDDEVTIYKRVESVSVDEDGTFSTHFKVPAELNDGDEDEDVASGTYYVYVTYADSNEITAVAEFTVVVPEIELDADEGPVGTSLKITGSDFADQVNIYFSTDEAYVGEDIDDEVTIYECVESSVPVEEDGKFSTHFKVPTELNDGDEDEDVTSGTYYVYVTYADSNEITAFAEFTVVVPKIELLDADEGPVGTSLKITGSDFADQEKLTVKYNGEEIDIASGDQETDRYGNFTVTIVIPESTVGTHTIAVRDESDFEAEAEFTVKPEIDSDSTSGAAGDSVTISGTGFGDKLNVTIDFGTEKEWADTKTNRDGSFQTSINVPPMAPGTHTVSVEDEDGNSAELSFTIAASLSLSKTEGSVDTEVIVSGTGFIPSHKITITYATEPIEVATTTADVNGAFSATFKVPPSQPGEHTITATDGENTLTATFTMESTAPPVPAPLLPESGAKTKQRVHFDWDDISDPSGVTYTLQIAFDESFIDIALEKVELNESEYTLTKEEELESTRKEAPYYWRLQVVDGAGNESEWTNPRSLYVGFIFELAGWVLYTLVGVGALLLLFAGFLLVRRLRRY